MKRDLVFAGLFWGLLTAVGLFLVLRIDPLPIRAAEEAEIIDDAFRLLLLLGTPVFTFVIAGLAYSVFRFRHPGDTPGEGPPIHTSRPVTWAWFAITSGLAVFIIFNPGLKGLRELRANRNADLVIQVEARKWAWTYRYPQYDLTIEDAQELILPVDRRLRFEITSTDVLHSFWIPAFRMKIDAVPGRTTILFVTPNRTGSFEQDFNLRVQCAELCGTGHARMRTGLSILEQEDFDAWIRGQGSTAQP